MFTNEIEYFEEPRIAKQLFASQGAAFGWLFARLYIGWEFFVAGWDKVFGGTITWRFWNWGDSAYSLTGNANIGWIRTGNVIQNGRVVHLGYGDRVASYAHNAIAASKGPHPDVAYSWYVDFLKWVEKTGHPILGFVVPFGELLIGAALILGLLTGISAFLGSLLNFSFVFAGTAATNPLMILLAGGLILAWRCAGYYGLDYYVLPALGTPWQRGSLLRGRANHRWPGSHRPVAV